MAQKLWLLSNKKRHIFSIFFTIFCMSTATGLAFAFYKLLQSAANVSLFYILALVLVARYTIGYWYGIAGSLFSVICINYMFTYPYFQLNFTLTGYPLVFLCMLGVSLLVSAMTSHLSVQANVIAEREKQLAEAETEKMRANLLRAVSHDLRTPLTGIIGNSSVYLENETQLNPKEKRELITNIYNDSHWLLNMVENLLTVTRIAGDNFAINTVEESVEEVLSEALQKLHKRYPHSRINARFPEEFILLPMDAILIEQVIINLVENAIVHAKSQAPIDLSVKNFPDKVSFSIKDYGVGLPKERLNHLFDGSAYTPSQTSDGNKGMGIGLSICKTIITAHHGTIIGQNHTNGAEFIFTLPKEQNTVTA